MRKAPPSRPSPLDLTPILGLVAILIPMLLMAYIPHVLATIDTRVPAICGGCGEVDPEIEVVPTVHLSEQGLRLEQVVVTSGASPGELTLPCTGTCREAGDYDWGGMQDALAKTRAETSSTGRLTIVVSNDVVYDVVVNTMDACRERLLDDGSLQSLYPHATLGSAG